MEVTANRHRLLLGVAIVTLGPSLVQAQNTNNNPDAGMPWEGLQAATLGKFAGLPPTAQKTEPFQLFDNVAYVGLETVGAYLIPTPAGLILMDTTGAATADLVLENVRTLGHDPAQIKYLLITHGDAGNLAGAGRIRQVVPGARVGMAPAAWEAAKGLTRDLVINDGDTLILGDVQLWFYLMPGHSPGSFVTEAHGVARGREYRTLIGAEFAPAPGMTAAALKNIERLKELGPWDAMFPSNPYLAPVALPLTARQILAGGCGGDLVKTATFCEGWPGGPTNYSAAVGAQRVNAYLDQIRTALQNRLARER